MPLDTLDQRWKEYVLQAAQKYKEQEAKEKDDEKEKGKAGGKKKQ
jgi:hypothetical protein